MSRIKELEERLLQIQAELEKLKAEEQEPKLPRKGQLVEVWDYEDNKRVIRHDGDRTVERDVREWEHWRPLQTSATRIEWSGGENPVGDVLVAYEKRNAITDIQYARGLNWEHCKALKAHDIVAYWVLEEE